MLNNCKGISRMFGGPAFFRIFSEEGMYIKNIQLWKKNLNTSASLYHLILGLLQIKRYRLPISFIEGSTYSRITLYKYNCSISQSLFMANTMSLTWFHIACVYIYCQLDFTLNLTIENKACKIRQRIFPPTRFHCS